MMVGIFQFKRLMIASLVSLCFGIELAAMDTSAEEEGGVDASKKNRYDLPSTPRDITYLQYELRVLSRDYCGPEWIKGMLSNLLHSHPYPQERKEIFKNIVAIGSSKLVNLTLEQGLFLVDFLWILNEAQGTQLCAQLLAFASGKKYNIHSMIKAWPEYIIKLKRHSIVLC
jgi:hypothetical protein